MSDYQLGYDVALPPVTSTAVGDPADGASPIGTLFEAARRSAQYDVAYGKVNAMSDAIDARNQSIKGAIGITLDNPMQGGYVDEAQQRYTQLYGDSVLASENPPDSAGIIAGYRMDAYNQAVAAIRQQHPEIPGLDVPLDQAAAGLANQASAQLGQAQQNVGGWTSTLTSLAGGLVGGFRDPINVASMMVPVGGALKAGSLFGRIVSGTMEGAAVNAGVTALSEPAIQQFQAERGMESGALPAAKDIGASLLFGAALGGFGGALHHAFAGTPEIASRAVGGDLDAATQLAQRVPVTAAPELHATIGAEAADRIALADPPADVRPQDGAQAVREAIRFGEDPDAAPLPAMPPAVPDGTTDHLAQQVLDGMVLPPDEYRARTEARAQAIDPEAFTAAQEADTAVAAARSRLADLGDEIGRTAESGDVAPNRIADLEQQLATASAARVSDAQAKVAAIETELAGITGKRRSSPRAKALRDALPAARAALDGSVPGEAETALQAEIARLRAAGDQMRGGLVPAFRAREQILRLALNDAVQRRGALGPRLFKARAQAEAEAAAMGFERGPAPTIDDALTVFQGSAAARASALASDNPNIRMLGRLASLSPEAVEATRRGVLAPELAQHVATTVPDPAEHLAALQAVAATRPRTEAEARAALTDEVQSRSVPEAVQRMLGAETGDEVPREVPAPAEPHDTPADAAKQVEQLEEALRPVQQQQQDQEGRPPKPRRTRPANPQSLTYFLKLAGGIQDQGGELRARDLHRQFPGLVNKNGMTLDRAREVAAEAGYLGADTERAVTESTINDLLDAIDSHPVYSVHDQAQVLERDAKSAMRADQERHQAAYERARDEVRQNFEEMETPPDPIVEHAVARYMIDHGVSFDDAVEPAVMAMEPRTTDGEPDFEIPFDIPSGESEALPEPGDDSAGGEHAPGDGTAGEPVRDAGESRQTERTAAGEQGLVPGITPITERERLEARARQPLRGGDAAPPEGGLFDQDVRQQGDLFDAVPLAQRDDGADLRLGNEDKLLDEPEREDLLSRLTKDCQI